MSYAFRIFLETFNGADAVSDDYISRTRANDIAARLHETFPNNRYFVRRVMVRDDNGRTR